MNIINDNLLASLEAEFDDDDLRRFQREVLATVEIASVRGVLFDLSKVRVLDSYQFSQLVETAKMATLLGAKPIFVGFQAGVASSLIDFDVDLDAIETVVTVEDGLERLSLEQDRHQGNTAAEEKDISFDHQGETNDGNAP